VRAHDRGVELRGDVDQRGIRPAPGVVEQVGAGLASTEITTSGYADRTLSTKETTRRFSSSSSMNSPGAALMPPMSTISAPWSTTWATRSKARSSAQVAPRS
jgi:hypothetical protein